MLLETNANLGIIIILRYSKNIFIRIILIYIDKNHTERKSKQKRNTKTSVYDETLISG